MSSKTRSGKDDARGGKIQPQSSTLQARELNSEVSIATEPDVRIMRDQIYGKPITDEEWAKSKGNWMADLDWLLEQVRLDEKRKRCV
jgi:hypothetical protein